MLNGQIYFVGGLIFLIWPGLVQTLFQDPAFAGHEEALFRLIGLLLAANGWLYIFGGLSDARQFVAATVVERLTLVPAVLVFFAVYGIFPHISFFSPCSNPP